MSTARFFLKFAALLLVVSTGLFGCGSHPTAIEDVTAPAIEMVSPEAVSTVPQSELVVRGTATDDVGITRMTYSLTGASEQKTPIPAGPTVTFEFTVPALEPGANSITIAAFAAAGNRAEAGRHVMGLQNTSTTS